MQLEYTGLKKIWQSTLKVLPLVVFIFATILWCGAGYAHASSENSGVLYAKSGSNQFSVVLVPDDNSEIFPDDDNLVKVIISGKAVPFVFSADQQGQIAISGSLPGLPDGKHNASIETYTPDKQRIDDRQALFFVDSIPPVIKLVEPVGPLPRTSPSLLFVVKDTENGSGVVPDPVASSLQVDITGAEVFSKTFVLKNDALHLLVTLTFKESIASPDYRFKVRISLKDRAGNMGQFTRDFKTAELIQPEFISLCKENDTSILSTLGFLVYPKEKGLQLRSGESRSLSFLTYGNYGKEYTYPPICVNDYGKTAPEFSQLSKFFQTEIGKRIEVIGSSGNITVEKQADKDHTDHRIAFNVTQKSAEAMGDQMGSIRVRFPVSFSLDKTINFCPYDDYEKIPESAFTYTYETITIPVVLEVAKQPIKMRMLQEGDRLVSQVKFNSVDLMDTAASWFEIDGEKYWYEATGDMCIAKGPVREGTVHYRLAAVHAFAVFRESEKDGGAGDRTFHNEGDFIVQMSPPVISGLSYDRQTNALHAIVTDEGTPAGVLDIKLRLSGYDIDFIFDASAGKLKAILPFTPLSVVVASLQVTDLAGQTTSAKCTVFGNPENSDNAGSESGSAAQHNYFVASYSKTGAGRNVTGTNVIGSTGSGMHLVKVCTKENLQWGFYNKGKFIAVRPGSASLIRLRVKDTTKIISAETRQPEKSSDDGGNEGIEIFYNHYNTSLYEPASRNGASTKISLTGGQPAGITSKQKIYYITGYYKQNRFIPTDFNIGLGFTTKVVKDCHVEKRDISSPVIKAFYDTVSGDVTGTVHDHGMPLSQLEVNFFGRNDSKNGHPFRKSLPVTFKNGQVIGRFEPPARGESFVLEIKAVDRAGNAGIATIKLVIPRSPPVVEIQVETEKSNLVFNNDTLDINAYMTAEATDASKILPGGTTFWLDGQVLSQFNRMDIEPYSLRSGAFQRSAFHYEGMYAAKIMEGPHVARFRATDSTGLTAETTRPFDFSLAPVIRDLTVMPGAVTTAGGPVFTAMVIDRGADLDLDGLSVVVNGEQVDPARLFYDAESGYFAVEGPLDLSDGRHTVKLTATDSRGIQASASLQFIRRLQVVLTPGPEAVEGLNIETVSLMELRNHNGDGQANPGELIRLFIPLRNESIYGGEQCRASLLTGNEKITVETGSVLYGQLDPSAVTAPLKGFDLKIDREVRYGVVSDPYDTHFDLTVACASEKEWRMPLILPIYRQSVPVDISSAVSVTIENLPSATTVSEIMVHGMATSTSAFIEAVVVRVNGAAAIPALFNRDGGRFEVTVPLEEGPNVIEVEATDRTGASGFVTSYIHRAPAFVPPAIAITTPANNTFFQCDNLTVTGTYDPGSSEIGSITINAPLWEPNAQCPVTIVGESQFIANCGQVTMDGGVYSVEAILETTQGVQAHSSRGITVGDCF